MAVTGKQKKVTEFNSLSVGFTSMKIVAVNPNRAELNAILGKEDTEGDKEITYLGTDQEGADRMRMLFVLKDDKNDKTFFHSFNLTNKVRKNKDKDKCQIVNSTCSTSWAPLIPAVDKKGKPVLDEDGKPTYSEEVNESLIQDWFANFTTKEKEVLGPKKWRKALSGEEELVTLLRSWLGRLDFMDPETEVFVDTSKLFKEDFKELRELISLDEEGKFTAGGLDTEFVVLLGVRIDEEDPTKKYQQVWAKSFLPAGFMKYINNGMKFPTPYSQKVWKKFQEEVTGEYGFNGFTELVPLKDYDEAAHLAAGSETGKEIAAPQTSEY
jgi:hypothetical protein